MTNQELLAELFAIEGFDDLESFLDVSVMDSVVPGICNTCHATTDCEPDARHNHCDNCGANTVESGLVLAGII